MEEERLGEELQAMANDLSVLKDAMNEQEVWKDFLRLRADRLHEIGEIIIGLAKKS